MPSASDTGSGNDKAIVQLIIPTTPSTIYVPGSFAQPAPGTIAIVPDPTLLRPVGFLPGSLGHTIPPDWLDQIINIYRPADSDDEAGGRTVDDQSAWTLLFRNVPCAMILESATEANPEDAPHQVLEQVARYCFFMNIPVTVGANAVRDSDLIVVGQLGPNARILVVKSWEQWPGIHPSVFKVHAQEVRP